ncbi:MAG: WD40 repeat domain-containing protein [Flavobacteriales bacterium]|nr:WD40 repeat domain-containing protein [Flavobacteriales bacterium]
MMKIEKIRELSGHAGPIYRMCFGRSENHLLTASGDCFVAEWDFNLGVASPFSIKLEHPCIALLYLQEQNTLICGTITGGMHVVNLNLKKEEKLLQVHEDGLFALCYIEEEKWVIAGGGQGFISVWNAETWELVRHFKVAQGKIRHIRKAKDRVIVSSADGTVRILDLPWLNILETIEAHEGGALCTIDHPSKPVMISGGKDGYLRLWHSNDSRLLMEIPAHNFGIYDLVISPDKSLLASASRDKSVKIWGLNDLSPLDKIARPKYEAHTHSVNTLLWNDNPELLISAGDDRKIKCWKIST